MKKKDEIKELKKIRDGVKCFVETIRVTSKDDELTEQISETYYDSTFSCVYQFITGLLNDNLGKSSVKSMTETINGHIESIVMNPTLTNAESYYTVLAAKVSAISTLSRAIDMVKRNSQY